MNTDIAKVTKNGDSSLHCNVNNRFYNGIDFDAFVKKRVELNHPEIKE